MDWVIWIIELNGSFMYYVVMIYSLEAMEMVIKR